MTNDSKAKRGDKSQDESGSESDELLGEFEGIVEDTSTNVMGSGEDRRPSGFTGSGEDR